MVTDDGVLQEDAVTTGGSVVAAAAAGTVRLGDLTVNRMGFGAMRVCGPDIWGPPKDRPNAHRVLRRAIELGVNFFDTADSYGPEVDEMLIAEALHPYPPGLVIGTKGGLVRPTRHAWDPNGRPEHLRRAIDGSLKRLRLERIDLYQLHAPDPKVPFADSVGALADAQRAGKIRHIGVSNVSVRELAEARRIAPIVSVQNEYNLGDRELGRRARRVRAGGDRVHPVVPARRRAGAQALVEGPAPCGKSAGATPAQVAIAWLLARSPVMLPIPGTASIPHLEENVAAAALKLSAADLAAL